MHIIDGGAQALERSEFRQNTIALAAKQSLLEEAIFPAAKEPAENDSLLHYAAFRTKPDRSARRKGQEREDKEVKKEKKEKRQEKKDSKSEKSEQHERILKAAESLSGEKLWEGKFAKITKNGDLGCAVAVSKALMKADVSLEKVHTGVWDLENELRAKDWTKHPLSEAQAGDVVVGHDSKNGNHNHIGIISRIGWVWNNSPRFGNTWSHEPLTTGMRPAWLFDGYDTRYVLRAPK